MVYPGYTTSLQLEAPKQKENGFKVFVTSHIICLLWHIYFGSYVHVLVFGILPTISVYYVSVLLFQMHDAPPILLPPNNTTFITDNNFMVEFIVELENSNKMADEMKMSMKEAEDRRREIEEAREALRISLEEAKQAENMEREERERKV